jgi:hypothetical protein
MRFLKKNYTTPQPARPGAGGGGGGSGEARHLPEIGAS